MRVALLYHNARAGDAIGNQVAAKFTFFHERGADVRVFIENDLALHPTLHGHCRVWPKLLSESIVRAIRTIAFGWERHVFRIGASIGATTITRSSPELGEILHEADKACYAAKESGRNRVCIYDLGRRPPFETRAADAAGIPPVIMH